MTSAVTFIMLGMGLEAIFPVAAMDDCIGTKHFSVDHLSIFNTVTADLESASNTFKGSMVHGGTDVSIYVSELHALAHVLEHINGPVPEVTWSPTKHSFSVHENGVNDFKVCEKAYHVVITVGTVPVNVPPGTRYLSVY